MIQNIEIVILMPDKAYDVESFNSEFSALAYYYFLKVKKVNTPLFNYIKIWIENSNGDSKLNYGIHEKILFIETKYDFSSYLLLKNEEKIKFQNHLISKILINAFSKYDLDNNILLDAINELKNVNQEIVISYFKKKIKENLIQIDILLDIDKFSLRCEIENKKEKKELVIFDFLPTTLVFAFFKKIKILNNKEILIGNEKPLFKIDIEQNETSLIEENKHLIDSRLVFGNFDKKL